MFLYYTVFNQLHRIHAVNIYEWINMHLPCILQWQLIFCLKTSVVPKYYSKSLKNYFILLQNRHPSKTIKQRLHTRKDLNMNYKGIED